MALTMARARIGTIVMELMPRQLDGNTTGDGSDDDGFETDGQVPFWYTTTGQYIKWSVFLAFVVIFSLYLVLGYTHAKRRLKKGLRPLAYHRWMLSRAELARVDPAYAYPQAVYTNYQQGYYGMYAVPPPVYDPNNRPPMYEGQTKVDPSQARPGPEEDFAAPSGPPPAVVREDRTGGTASTNPFSSTERR